MITSHYFFDKIKKKENIMAGKIKVPKKRFIEFKRAAKYWIEIFGLKNWEIYIDFGGIEDDGDYAEVEYDYSTKIATIRLTDTCRCKQELEELQPDKRAFHEVCHLLLAGLNDMVKSTIRIPKIELDRESHSVIRVLENAIYDYYEGHQ